MIQASSLIRSRLIGVWYFRRSENNPIASSKSGAVEPFRPEVFVRLLVGRKPP
jgi:hypothetical protein